MKMEQDELKGKSLDEITALIKTLNGRIASKKAELDPLLKEVKPLRAKIQVKLFINPHSSTNTRSFRSYKVNINRRNLNTTHSMLISNPIGHH